MKKFVFIIFLLFYFGAFSQIRNIKSGWTAYTQAINIEDKQNWNFRISVKARKENNDNGSNCGIWCRIDNKDNTHGFFENQFYDTKVTHEWKTYEIKGSIDSTAQTLNIGTFAQDNGDFYFDDFKLEVNNGKSKKWINIPIKNSGFEENLTNQNHWFEGVISTKPTHAENFTIQTSEKQTVYRKKSIVNKRQQYYRNHA